MYILCLHVGPSVVGELSTQATGNVGIIVGEGSLLHVIVIMNMLST